MSSRRALIVGIASVVGLLAAVLAVTYLRGVEDRAFEGAKLVRVFLVDKDIPKGTPGDTAIAEEFIVADEIPQKVRPANAITSLEAIRGKVLVTALAKNQVVVDGQFVEPGVAQTTFAERIPQGQTAITISVDRVKGVANLLVPGDRVNIIVLDQAQGRYLYQNVDILAIDKTAAPEAGNTQAVQAVNSGVITLAVPADAALRIAVAAQTGALYLTLVPPDYQPADIPPVNPGNLYNKPLTPGGPQ